MVIANNDLEGCHEEEWEGRRGGQARGVRRWTWAHGRRRALGGRSAMHQQAAGERGQAMRGRGTRQSSSGRSFPQINGMMGSITFFIILVLIVDVLSYYNSRTSIIDIWT
jgi:hypothetical protein